MKIKVIDEDNVRIDKYLMNNTEYSSNFDDTKKEKLITINNVMDNSLNGVKYTSYESFDTLSILSDDLDKSLIDLVYLYYGSIKEYDESWKMTIQEFVNYLNTDILTDKRFDDLEKSDMHQIKHEIVKDYHHFVDEVGWIDDFNLNCLELIYEDYKREGGNIWFGGKRQTWWVRLFHL